MGSPYDYIDGGKYTNDTQEPETISLNPEYLDISDEKPRAIPSRRVLSSSPNMKTIPKELYDKFNYLGLIPNDVRSGNIGESDYSEHTIQPWSIMIEYQDKLNYLELDIVKRILRNKDSDSRLMDYEKCQHILSELIRIERLN